MTIGLMGKKIGMTQIFDQEGVALPVTMVSLGENIVVNKLSKAHNGYEAIQVAGFAVKEKILNKARVRCFEKANLQALAPLREFRVDDASGFTIGQPILIGDVLKEGMLG